MYLLHPSNIINNSTKYNLSNSFHGQTSLRNTIFSVLISGVKLLLIHNWFKKCWWIASYVFSILYNLIHFSLPFRPCNLLFQKKSKQGGRGKGFLGQFLWNIQGYQRNSMWNFQGLIKNKMEFSKGDQEKINVEIPWVCLVFGLGIFKGSNTILWNI